MQILSGTIIDPIARKTFGARLVISDTGHIQQIEPEMNPDPGYLLPGFVDSHVHIESSMLTPAAFAQAAIRQGTLAAVADPHEIANVLGKDGVILMIELARQTPFVFGFGAPSCVPATPFETSGATLDAAGVEQLMQLPEITHLSEVMNYPGILNNDSVLCQKIACAQRVGKPIDGHAPLLTGEGLRKYVSSAITTDHECVTVDEAREKIALGMTVQIRHGSAARLNDSFLPLIAEYPEQCMFCSDDIHPDDLLLSYINVIASRALAAGISIYNVLWASSVNPVRHYKLPIGLLQAGDSADFQRVDDLTRLMPTEVWLRGKCVFKNGQCDLPRGNPIVLNHFEAQPVTPSAFEVFAQPLDLLRVIQVHDGQLITHALRMTPLLSHDQAVADISRDVLYIAVINRYQSAKPAVGFIQGFGLQCGAIASSVAHDSHNIVAVGVTLHVLASAVNQVIANKGGLAVVDADGTALATLPLPIAGLISSEDAETVAHAYCACDTAAKVLGCTLHAPFMTLSFMALPVIPELKLTDRGLFDVTTFTHVPLCV
jgi:adenine deaminase